jgi:hypothetical protein
MARFDYAELPHQSQRHVGRVAERVPDVGDRVRVDAGGAVITETPLLSHLSGGRRHKGKRPRRGAFGREGE